MWAGACLGPTHPTVDHHAIRGGENGHRLCILANLCFLAVGQLGGEGVAPLNALYGLHHTCQLLTSPICEPYFPLSNICLPDNMLPPFAHYVTMEPVLGLLLHTYNKLLMCK